VLGLVVAVLIAPVAAVRGLFPLAEPRRVEVDVNVADIL